MINASPQPWIARFGVFEVNLKTGELRKQGARVKLQDQPFHVLAMLLEKPGEIVTREELQQRLWPKDTFVDFDHSLNKAINKVREALCDSADNPRFVETIPRRGYRFIYPIQDQMTAFPQRPGPEPLSLTEQESLVPQQESNNIPWWRRYRILVLPGFLLLLMAAYPFRPKLPPPRLGQPVQITNDGDRFKIWLKSGQENLYFQKYSGEQFSVYRVPMSGGTPAPVVVKSPVPGAQFCMTAVTPDEQELVLHLLNQGKSQKREGIDQLYMYNMATGLLRRVSDKEVINSTLTPDGQTVFFNTPDSEIFSVRKDGSMECRVISWAPDFIIMEPTISPNSQTMRFLAIYKDTSRQLWESRLDGTRLQRVSWYRPEWVWGIPACWTWSPDGDFFVFSTEEFGKRASIWAVREKGSLFYKANFSPVRLTSETMGYSFLTFSRDGRKIFAIGQLSRGELMRFDLKLNCFLEYMPGLSVEHLHFSSDGKSVVYTTFPEQTLWRSDTDGSNSLQLTFSPLLASKPRWSPDGTKILFMGRDSRNLNNKAYLISARGGDIKPIIESNLDVIDPQWSPNGDQIVYSTCFQDFNPPEGKIFILNVENNKTAQVKGSDELFAPDWSPDGKTLVATTVKDFKLMVFSFSRQEWSALTSTPAAFPEWSRGGKYLYYLALEKPELRRIEMQSRKEEVVTSTKGLSLTGSAGWWMGLTPADEPLVLRDDGSTEIYAFNWIAP